MFNKSLLRYVIPTRRTATGQDRQGIRQAIVQRLVTAVMADALLWEPGFMA